MKKITLFVQSALRQELRRLTLPPVVVSPWGLGYTAALTLYMKVIAAGTDPRFKIANPQNIHEKFFSYSAEGNWLRSTLRDSARVEAHLRLGMYSTLALEIRGYRKGATVPSGTFTFNFKPDGSCAGVSDVRL